MIDIASSIEVSTIGHNNETIIREAFIANGMRTRNILLAERQAPDRQAGYWGSCAVVQGTRKFARGLLE